MASVRADKCTDLFARIDALEKEYIDFLIDVCKIESPYGIQRGCRPRRQILYRKGQGTRLGN